MQASSAASSSHQQPCQGFERAVFFTAGEDHLLVEDFAGAVLGARDEHARISWAGRSARISFQDLYGLSTTSPSFRTLAASALCQSEGVKANSGR
jgi:hypothetical protein